MEDATDRPSYEPELAEPPTPSPQQKYSGVQRLWMMFTSPGDVFADIGIKPTWVLIMVLFVILGTFVNLIALPHVDTEATLRASLGDRVEDLSEAQIENMVEQAEKIGKFTPLFAIIIGPIAWAIMAAVFFVMLKISGGEADYVQTLSTTLHSYWPGSLVGMVLMAVLIQRVGMVPQNELTNVVKASLGAFLSPDSPAWLTAVASSISIFNIWTVILLIIGFTVVGKISRGKAAVVTLVPWGVYLVVKAGFAALTS